MVKIEILPLKKVLQTADQIVFGLFEGDKESSVLAGCDPSLGRFAREVLSRESFKGELGKTLSFYHGKSGRLLRVTGVGLGKRKDYSSEKVREAVGKASLQARSQKSKKPALLLETFLGVSLSLDKTLEALIEAVELALYQFEGYQKKKAEEKNSQYPETVFVATKNLNESKKIQVAVRTASAIAEGVLIARDLINTPGNKMNPEIFTSKAKQIAKTFRFKIQVLEKKGLVRENMGALLAVGQGSVIPPRMVVVSYKGRSKGAPIGIVGKGVTFDSGGISIKPSKGMEQMKYDMAGGAAVLGVMIAASGLKLPVNLVGVIPLAENMPSGSAIKPGDVVRAASGLSIEVVNTDAEGRLILADALHYIKRFKPKAVFDLATLTGAVTVVLGCRAMAAMGDGALIRGLQKAGESVNERVWELPLWPEYQEDIKSDVADLQNVGKGEAGTIIGAKFLEAFVDKAYPWVHLDIASTAWVERSAPSYCPKGGRAIGVRLLTEYLRNL